MKTAPNDIQRMALMVTLKANGWSLSDIGRAFRINKTTVSNTIIYRYRALKKRLEKQNGIEDLLNDKISVSQLLKLDLSEIAK